MDIRRFEQGDMTSVMNLAYDMYLESNYTIMNFDRQKVSDLFKLTITDNSFLCLVAQHGNNIIGVLLGKLFPYFFTNDLMATDIIVYVSKRHRGGITGTRFIRLFENWSKDKGAKCVNLGITAGIANDKAERLYKGLGFKSIGVVLRKEFT